MIEPDGDFVQKTLTVERLGLAILQPPHNVVVDCCFLHFAVSEAPDTAA
jgi:hypothetical protein